MTELTIVYTTRTQKKAAATLKLLEAHLQKFQEPNSSQHQVHFQPENVELTSLLSVRALARKLLASSIPHLDTVILNAGIIGLVGIDWPNAVWYALTDNVQALSWPTFKIPAVGLLTKPQLPQSTVIEPPLGEIFCANIFGHYMLAHWLMPLLHACPTDPGKVMWVSSVECTAKHFTRDDLQALRSPAAYEHTKRLQDLLALTAHSQPATHRSVASFLNPQSSLISPPLSSNNSQPQQRPQNFPPSIHVCHPGTSVTNIAGIPWFMFYPFYLGAYQCKFLGSPWAMVTPYRGATAISWLALVSSEEAEITKFELPDTSSGSNDNQDKVQELSDGGGTGIKWGSANLSRFAEEVLVRKTEVEDWGLDGSGQPYASSWWGGNYGRKRGTAEAQAEDVEKFIETGARAWREMESLRKEWETRIEEYEKDGASGSEVQ